MLGLQVENPIPFADSAMTRGLTTAYLHSRYAALLIFPAQLSADWSFSCIPLVESLNDPRNVATAVLYTVLAAITLKGLPCLPFGLSRAEAVNGRDLGYRACVLLGLLVSFSSLCKN